MSSTSSLQILSAASWLSPGPNVIITVEDEAENVVSEETTIEA